MLLFLFLFLLLLLRRRCEVRQSAVDDCLRKARNLRDRSAVLTRELSHLAAEVQGEARFKRGNGSARYIHP